MKLVSKQSLKATKQSILTTQVTRINFFFIALYAAFIIIFDSGNVITRLMVGNLWTLTVILLIVNTKVWYMARRVKNETYQKAMVWLLLATQIIFAGFIVYWERGMASMSTILFALPIVTAGVLLSRTASITTALLCIATYAFAAMKYFNDFFNEGYKIQLYGEIILFSGIFLTLAWFVNILTGENTPTK